MCASPPGDALDACDAAALRLTKRSCASWPPRDPAPSEGDRRWQSRGSSPKRPWQRAPNLQALGGGYEPAQLAFQAEEPGREPLPFKRARPGVAPSCAQHRPDFSALGTQAPCPGLEAADPDAAAPLLGPLPRSIPAILPLQIYENMYVGIPARHGPAKSGHDTSLTVGMGFLFGLAAANATCGCRTSALRWFPTSPP
jgi:hypothetical protein